MSVVVVVVVVVVVLLAVVVVVVVVVVTVVVAVVRLSFGEDVSLTIVGTVAGFLCHLAPTVAVLVTVVP